MAASQAGPLLKIAEGLATAALAEATRTSDATSCEILAELRHLHSTCDKLLVATAEASAASKNALATTAAANEASRDRIVKAVADASAATCLATRSAARTATLQWAYDHATVGEFAHAGKPLTAHDYNTYQLLKSGAFCAAAILAFNSGLGRYADGYVFEDTHRGKVITERNALASAAFRAAIIAQLHALIGVKPYEEVQGDGRYAIFLPAC